MFHVKHRCFDKNYALVAEVAANIGVFKKFFFLTDNYSQKGRQSFIKSKKR